MGSLKKIRIPYHSELLAEFMGIMTGDGHLGVYQVTIVTSAETDLSHASHIANLSRMLFDIEPTVQLKKYRRGVEIILSSKNVCSWLHSQGLVQGNKLKNGIRVPSWVKNNEKFQRAFIRGLFDTDGSIYLDTHVIKGKTYQNMGWTITNYSATFRNEIFIILEFLGFQPTLRASQKSIFMRRKIDIEKYFNSIGTNNQKHQERFLEYTRRRG